MENVKVKKTIGYWILGFFALVWAFITLYPFIITVFSSLKNNDEILGSMLSLPKNPLWENYDIAINNAKILISIFNSIFLAVVSTAGMLLFGSMIAYVLSRTTHKYNKWVFGLFMAGIVLPIYATLVPLMKIVSKVGFLRPNTFYTLILIYIAICLPEGLFIMTGYMKGISKELDEAAIIDGCNTPQLFFKVLLPISIPALSTAAIISFLNCYNEMVFALLFITTKIKYTVSIALLYFVGKKTVDMGPLFAAIILTTLPMLIFYMFFQDQIQSGMVAGAVKG
ncbi:MAG: carbohydrate ABC transporter permease [Dysgonamonadaceae bacterium]